MGCRVGRVGGRDVCPAGEARGRHRGNPLGGRGKRVGRPAGERGKGGGRKKAGAGRGLGGAGVGRRGGFNKGGGKGVSVRFSFFGWGGGVRLVAACAGFSSPPPLGEGGGGGRKTGVGALGWVVEGNREALGVRRPLLGGELCGGGGGGSGDGGEGVVCFVVLWFALGGGRVVVWWYGRRRKGGPWRRGVVGVVDRRVVGGSGAGEVEDCVLVPVPGGHAPWIACVWAATPRLKRAKGKRLAAAVEGVETIVLGDANPACNK